VALLDERWCRKNENKLRSALFATIPVGNGRVQLQGVRLPLVQGFRPGQVAAQPTKGIYDPVLRQLLVTDGAEFFAFDIGKSKEEVPVIGYALSHLRLGKFSDVVMLDDGRLLALTQDDLHFIVSPAEFSATLVYYGPKCNRTWDDIHKWLAELSNAGTGHIRMAEMVPAVWSTGDGNHLYHTATKTRFFTKRVPGFAANSDVGCFEYVGYSKEQRALFVYVRDEQMLVMMRNREKAPTTGTGFEQGFWMGVEDVIRSGDTIGIYINDPAGLGSGGDQLPKRLRPCPPASIDGVSTMIVRCSPPFTKPKSDVRPDRDGFPWVNPERYIFDMPWYAAGYGEHGAYSRLVLETPEDDPAAVMLNNGNAFKMEIYLRQHWDATMEERAGKRMKAKRLQDGSGDVQLSTGGEQSIIIGNYAPANGRPSKYQWEVVSGDTTPVDQLFR